jgi:uncharacterized protein (UPF0332 family)
MGASEVQPYLNRAHHDLQATQINIEQGFFDVAVTRAYYAMFYAASALLASEGISRSKHWPKKLCVTLSGLWLGSNNTSPGWVHYDKHRSNSAQPLDRDRTASCNRVCG